MRWQALLESGFLTVMPILLLSGDRQGMGVVTSTYDYGTTTFALVVLTVSFKVRRITIGRRFERGGGGEGGAAAAARSEATRAGSPRRRSLVRVSSNAGCWQGSLSPSG